jgi:hypothetical protein
MNCRYRRVRVCVLPDPAEAETRVKSGRLRIVSFVRTVGMGVMLKSANGTGRFGSSRDLPLDSGWSGSYIVIDK